MVLAEVLSTVLNKKSEGGQPCVFPDLGGNDFCFSPFGVVPAVELAHRAFVLTQEFSVPTFFWAFIRKQC